MFGGGIGIGVNLWEPSVQGEGTTGGGGGGGVPATVLTWAASGEFTWGAGVYITWG